MATPKKDGFRASMVAIKRRETLLGDSWKSGTRKRNIDPKIVTLESDRLYGWRINIDQANRGRQVDFLPRVIPPENAERAEIAPQWVLKLIYLATRGK